ncbi:MAG: AraC family transcriptional regulator [Xanthomonadales bacterium]|nr:AraC family transcriptional regulator [Xanthomonadales bacterium]
MPEQLSTDLLHLILEAHALRVRIFATPKLCGRWQGVHPSAYQASFHLVGEGQCYLHMRHLRTPIPLQGGDLVLLPRDDWHILSSEPHPMGEEAITGDIQGPMTAMICGEIRFDQQTSNPILDALPPLVVMRKGDADGALDMISRLLALEAERNDLGNVLVLNRLSEALFVMILRHHLKHEEQKKGLLAALADPRLTKALVAIHRSPEERWQVGSLAKVAGMSRTVFAQRFAEVLGLTPIEYLTRWRMQLAQQWLRERREPVSVVAKKLGYETETAFRRAFQRITGMTPGRLRRQG